MQKILEDLGLTKNEIKLYLVLLGLGENTVGPLISKLKIHRQIAYDALNGLIGRDLVIKTSKNNRFYYRITDPSNIMASIKHQEKIAKKFIKQVNNKLAGVKDRQEVKIIEGEEAYIDWTLQGNELHPRKTVIYIVSSGMIEWENIMMKNNALRKLNTIRKKKEIKVKMIYNELARKKISGIEKVNYENRFISNKFSMPTEFAITPDSVEFVSFGSELLTIVVKNMKLREDYLKYFEKLWKIAKP